MRKFLSFLENTSLIFLILVCMCACTPTDSTDLVEKRGYPRSSRVPSAKDTSKPLEKPYVEEEFFEAERL